MTANGDSDKSNSAVDAALERFRSAWFSGDRPDPDLFCRENSECGPELRELIGSFLLVAEKIPVMGSPSDEDSVEPDGLEEGRRLGDFQILKEIGRGGMGIVYEAEQISLQRRVALKVLSPHLSFSKPAIMKFRREAEAGGRQRHPGIVSVYAVGEQEGIHFIVQELIEGGTTLSNRLEKLCSEDDLPLGYFREVAQTTVQVTDALDHAHESGVIHRDVKPSNIMLDRDGRPKLTDFGLAKIKDALALSRSGEFAGTPYYMSPEQVSSRKRGIDHRTDVYSLGVTLYEMLTLTRPFDGESSHEVLKKVLFQEPRDPCRVNTRVPRDLGVICLKAMEKGPDRRYQTMGEFKEDLNRFILGEPIRAKPAGALTRIGKRLRRNPVLSTLVGLIILSLIALGFYIPYAHLAQRKTERLEREILGLNLINFAGNALSENPGLALNLGIEGAERHPGHQANEMLIDALLQIHERKVLSHDSEVSGAVFSPDAMIAASVGPDGIVRLWDWTHGEKVQEFRGYEDGINTIAYDPGGQSLLTGSDDGIVRLCNADNGSEIWKRQGHTAPVRSVNYSHDGTMAASASEDMTVRLWDLSSGEIIATFTGHGWIVRYAAFNPTDDRLVTASEDGAIRLWDVREKKEIASRTEHEGVVTFAAFSPDGSRIVFTYDDGTVYIWHTNKNETTTFDHQQEIVAAAISPDGKRLAVASKDEAVVIWDLHSQSIIAELKGHNGAINAVAYSRDGSLLITSSEDGTARVWNATPGKALPKLDFNGPLIAYSFNAACDRIAVATTGGGPSVEIWDIFNMRKVTQSPRYEDEGEIKFLTLSPDGSRLATVMSLNYVHIHSLVTGKELAGYQHQGDVNSVEFSMDGSRVMTASSDKTCRVYDAITGEAHPWLEYETKVNHALFSPSRKWVAAILGNDTVMVRSMDGNDKKFVLKTEEAIITLLYSLDNRWIFTTSKGIVQIWDSETGDFIEELKGHRKSINRVLVSRNHEFLVTASDDLTLNSWDTGSWNELREFRIHMKHIRHVAISSDDKMIVSASEDHFARLWSMEDDSPFALKHSDPVIHAEFCGGDKWVVTVTSSGEVRLWPVDPVELARQFNPRNLTTDEEYNDGLIERTAIQEIPTPVSSLEKSNQADGSNPNERTYPPRTFSTPPALCSFLVAMQGEDSGYSIMRCDPERGKDLQVLLEHKEGYFQGLAMSGDGSEFAYGVSAGKGPSEIHVASLKGELLNTRCIWKSEKYELSALTWHPKKELIYLSMTQKQDVRKNKTYMICRVDTAGSADQKERLILGSTGKFFDLPRISPDGSRIAFVHCARSNHNYERELWMARLTEDGKAAYEPKRLTNDCLAEKGHAFRSDGKGLFRLYYEEEVSYRLDGLSMNGNTSEPLIELEVSQNSRLRSPAASRSGVIAVSVSEKGRNTIWLVDENGRTVFTQPLESMCATWIAFIN